MKVQAAREFASTNRTDESLPHSRNPGVFAGFQPPHASERPDFFLWERDYLRGSCLVTSLAASTLTSK
jgi:hypothetical protein